MREVERLKRILTEVFEIKDPEKLKYFLRMKIFSSKQRILIL